MFLGILHNGNSQIDKKITNSKKEKFTHSAFDLFTGKTPGYFDVTYVKSTITLLLISIS